MVDFYEVNVGKYTVGKYTVRLNLNQPVLVQVLVTGVMLLESLKLSVKFDPGDPGP